MALAPSHVSCVTWEGPLNSTESQAQMGGADTDFLGEWVRTTWNKVYEAPDAAPGTQKGWINVSNTSIHTEARWGKTGISQNLWNKSTVDWLQEQRMTGQFLCFLCCQVFPFSFWFRDSLKGSASKFKARSAEAVRASAWERKGLMAAATSLQVWGLVP